MNWFNDELSFWIVSMAGRKAAVLDQLRNGCSVRVEHLLKLYFYPEAEYEQRGWMESVWKVLSEVGTIGSGRFPTFKEIMFDIWDIPYGKVIRKKLPGILRGIIASMSDYRPVRLPLSEAVISNCCEYLEKFHMWLAEELSADGIISFADVQLKIAELLSEPECVALAGTFK